jgi:hypothetical protein
MACNRESLDEERGVASLPTRLGNKVRRLHALSPSAGEYVVEQV